MFVGIQRHGPAGKLFVRQCVRLYAAVVCFARAYSAYRRVKFITCKNAGQVSHVGLVVGVNFVAAGVGFFGAISVELVQAYAEQLHYLAGVVFIRHAARSSIFFLVAPGVKVVAHGGV